jgi:hypothetical protein
MFMCAGNSLKISKKILCLTDLSPRWLCLDHHVSAGQQNRGNLLNPPIAIIRCVLYYFAICQFSCAQEIQTSSRRAFYA